VRGGSRATLALLAFGHGSNDAQKSVGVIDAVLVADGRANHAGDAAA
jgi:phosphate/sulfate permease